MQLELRRLHPDIEETFPALPPKTCFPSLAESFLDARADLLSVYTEALLTVFSNKRVLQADAETLFDFLDMKKGGGERDGSFDATSHDQSTLKT